MTIIMDKVKKLLLVNVPTGKCNFKCPYCFITQKDAWENEKFERTPEEIGRAFQMKRFGGPCFVNICSRGETLIYPQMVEVIKAILEQGHYVEVVTNGSISARFEKISKFSVELLNRLSFKFSFHYMELKRLNLFDVFFDNIKLMKETGASFTVELMPVDEEEPYIEEIKNLCYKHLGALCHTTIARDDRKKSIPVLSKHNLDEYYRVWSVFDSQMLNFKKRVFQEKRNEFCYAGDWSLYINLFSGAIQKCYCTPVCGNIYNFGSSLPFEAIGKCPISHCYNAHALLTFGLLPEVDAPYYSEIRNRTCEDGTEWLAPRVKFFFNSKLIESNKEYCLKKKEECTKKNKRIMRRTTFIRNISKPFSKLIVRLSPEIKDKVKTIVFK